jgi:hypothetical protein
MPPPACQSGTCEIKNPTTDFRALVVPRFEVTAHNSCKFKAPAVRGIGPSTTAQSLMFSVEVAFYSKEGLRTGIGTFYVGTMEPGERIWHAYEIPDYARALTAVSSIKVRSITDAYGARTE